MSGELENEIKAKRKFSVMRNLVSNQKNSWLMKTQNLSYLVSSSQNSKQKIRKDEIDMKCLKFNKLLSLLLTFTMVMTSMLPTVVFATDELAVREDIYSMEQIDIGELKNLYIGDVALIENGILTSNTVQGVIYSNKVLYLENAEISGGHSFKIEPDKIKTTAIYADGPLTLSLSGSSYIRNNSDTSLDFSVYSTEELTITGTGNLSVSGFIDAFSAKTIYVENTGKLDINCVSSGLIARDGNFSLQDSSVTILTTATGWGTAIVTTSGNFSMESGSLTIDMPKGNGGFYTYGLYINGDVTISSGTVDIEAQQDSIWCKGNCTILSGNITLPDGIRAQSSGTLTIKNGFVSVGGKGMEGLGGVYLFGGKIIFSGNKISSSNVIFVDTVNFELEGKDRLNLEGGSFVLNQLGNISYQLWCEKDTSEDVSKRIAFISGDMLSEDQISFFIGLSGKKTYVKGCIADTKGGSIPVNTQITEREFSSPVKAGYIFGGWYDNVDFSGNAVTIPTAGKTYYAKWEEKADSIISFKNGLDLNKIYDGKAVSLSPNDYTVTEGAGNIVFSYEAKDNNEWEDIDTAPTNVGTYRVKATVAENGSYKSAETDWKEFTISKATPTYNVPSGLTATIGQTLVDVRLPNGFTWQDILTTSVGTIGTHAFKVIYTPTDTVNYNIVTDIVVILTINPKIEGPNELPVINASDKTLTFGNPFNPLESVTAFDKEDGDLTNAIEVLENNVDTTKIGTYTVTYKVIDSKGGSSTKTITVIIKEKDTQKKRTKSESDN